MPLKKVIVGSNMYQDWVTHTHTHLGGECPHKCSYCYVDTSRFGRAERYKGKPRLIEEEFKVDYGKGKTVFVEHMNDMFAGGVPDTLIYTILAHLKRYNETNFVFQTKNPLRAWKFKYFFPHKYIIGTTVETNQNISYRISQAPSPLCRKQGIKLFSDSGIGVFVTIEPIMDLDVDELVEWLVDIEPIFINIGADSKRCNLPEPSAEKIRHLIKAIQDKGLTIKKKSNLSRLLGPDKKEEKDE